MKNTFLILFSLNLFISLSQIEFIKHDTIRDDKRFVGKLLIQASDEYSIDDSVSGYWIFYYNKKGQICREEKAISFEIMQIRKSILVGKAYHYNSNGKLIYSWKYHWTKKDTLPLIQVNTYLNNRISKVTFHKISVNGHSDYYANRTEYFDSGRIKSHYYSNTDSISIINYHQKGDTLLYVCSVQDSTGTIIHNTYSYDPKKSIKEYGQLKDGFIVRNKFRNGKFIRQRKKKLGNKKKD